MSDCRVGDGGMGPCKCDECKEWELRYDQGSAEDAEYEAWKEQMEAQDYEDEIAESYIFEKLGMVLVLSNGEPTGICDGWRLVKGQWERVEDDGEWWSANPEDWRALPF